MLTKAEWQQAFAEQPPEGIAKVVEKHLLTEGQRLWLEQHDLTVLGLLTEQFSIGQYAQVQFLFGEWNRVIGYQQFRV